MTCGRVLERCIFCGSDDMSEEHIVADWVLRAFTRSRNPRPGFNGRFIGSDEMRLQVGDAITTAKVVCGTCNNEWMSRIDEAAADALKPLIRRKTSVSLSEAEQAAVAAWVFKSALIFDAGQMGRKGKLAPLAEGFGQARTAPPGCTIYMGPSPPTPFSVPGIPEVAGLALFGVKTARVPVNVSLTIDSHDGTESSVRQFAVDGPAWIVMLGQVQAIISGQRAPYVPTDGQGYVRVWPTQPEHVLLHSEPPPAAPYATT